MVVRRLWARTPGISAVLVVLGLVLTRASAAGVADITKHGRRQIGPGVIYGRYTRLLTNTRVQSSDLYDIAAAHGPVVDVQDINEDGAGNRAH